MHNEGLRKAIRWLSDTQNYGASAINEAIQRFDLSPLDADFLVRNFLHADRTVSECPDPDQDA